MGSNRGRPLQHIVPLLVLLACDKTIATIPIGSIGGSGEVPIAAPPGSELGFAVHAASYSYTGQNHILVKSELLKAGRVVATHECQGFEFEGGAGTGCGATHHSSACSITVPPEGADAVRVSTRLERSGDVQVEGLEVRVKQ